jgi:DNA modification methylase
MLILGDYIEELKKLKKGVVDLVICDLNYGVLNKQNKNVQEKNLSQKPNFKVLWTQLKRVTKPKSIIIFFGTGMYTCEVMMSNKTWWRYNWIWKKGEKRTGFLNCNERPMLNHEDIIIFSKEVGLYQPQMTVGEKNYSPGIIQTAKVDVNGGNCYGKHKIVEKEDSDKRYPISVINFDLDNYGVVGQKPLMLAEYLVNTYTKENDLVVDLKMRGGSFGMVCKSLDRKYLGIDDNEENYLISRINIHNTMKVNKIKI